MFYEIKLVRLGVDDNGKEKKFTESYIVKAQLIFEALTKFEEDILKEYPEHEIVSVKKLAYSDVLYVHTENPYYRVKFNTVTVDDKTGKDKREPDFILIQAGDIDGAKAFYERYIENWVVDTVLESVAETKYVDYYNYFL